MPKGPKGEKRPADVIGNAVKVMRIAVAEESEQSTAKVNRARKAGLKGGAARAAKLSSKQRSEIARVAASVRWKKSS